MSPIISFQRLDVSQHFCISFRLENCLKISTNSSVGCDSIFKMATKTEAKPNLCEQAQLLEAWINQKSVIT